MRHTILLLLISFLCSISFAQNLVPNGDFEEYEDCNEELLDPILATGWLPFKGTPDYYNTCNTNGPVGVPYNYHGFQPTLSGDGYGGLVCISYNNHREIIATELTQPLEIGTDYYIEFYWSRSMGGGSSQCNCANSHLGALLTTQSYHNVQNPIEHDNFAHVYETEVLLDSTNWNSISGWINADSAYTHIAIGNFFDLEIVDRDYLDTDSTQIVYSSYYYIENVCVSTDPAFCGLVKTSHLKKDESVTLFPNPTSDIIHIESRRNLGVIGVHDIYGHTLRLASKTENVIDVSSLNSGVYFVVLEVEDSVVVKKFIKQ